jgi:hypothetical protein
MIIIQKSPNSLYIFFRNTISKNKLLLLLILLVIPIGLSHAIYITSFSSSGKLNNSLGQAIQIKMHSINNTSGSTIVVNGVMVQRDPSGLVLQQNYFIVQSNMTTNMPIYFMGNITKSTNPNIIGNPISIIAYPSTGNMTLVFGFSNYTGIGTVYIK